MAGTIRSTQVRSAFTMNLRKRSCAIATHFVCFACDGSVRHIQPNTAQKTWLRASLHVKAPTPELNHKSQTKPKMLDAIVCVRLSYVNRRKSGKHEAQCWNAFRTLSSLHARAAKRCATMYGCSKVRLG